MRLRQHKQNKVWEPVTCSAKFQAPSKARAVTSAIVSSSAGDVVAIADRDPILTVRDLPERWKPWLRRGR
jgi:hypothetical protein